MRTNAEVGSSKWFGKIPNGWEMKPLKSLFRFSKGLSITKADLVDQGAPVVSYGQIHSKLNEYVVLNPTLMRYVSVDMSLAAPKAYCQKDGFIFADTSEDVDGCGNCVRISSEISLQGGYHTIVLNPMTSGNTKYFAYLFLTDAWRSQIRRDLVDVKLFSVNQEKLKETYVVIPPTEAQRRIVAFLDERCAAIDDDIAKRREFIEKLGEYKKSVIAKAVTKGIDPDAEMRNSGVEWIGEVPTDWDMLRLVQIATPVKHKNDGMCEQNLLSLSYGRIVRKDIEKASGLVPASYEGYNIVEKNDVVLRFTDLQNDKKSLRTGLVRERGIITSAYLTIRPDTNTVMPEYFHFVLHAIDVCKVFYNMGDGMRQTLDWRGVNRMFLPLPPLPEQRRIVAFLDERCSAIDEAVSRQEQLIEKLEEYRKSLIHHAVTGKIDCREAQHAR